MFRDIKEGFRIHVLETSGIPVYKVGRVERASDPRLQPMRPYEPGQIPPYPQLQDRVIDLTVNVDGKTDTYVVPENRDVALSPNVTLSCSIEPITNQLSAIRKRASDELSRREMNERTVAACDSIMEELDPSIRDKREQDRKIGALEEKVDRIGNSFNELKDLLMRKLN